MVVVGNGVGYCEGLRRREKHAERRLALMIEVVACVGGAEVEVSYFGRSC